MPGQLHIISPENHRTIIVIEKEPSLEQLQKAVGGYIEVVKVRFEGKIRDAYVNEEGLLKQLPYNPYASELSVNRHHLVGNIAIWVPAERKS